MIRFGPAGIPLSCKGRTLRDGVEDVHSLSLTAMEVQMVRSEMMVDYPEEEEIGLTVKDLTKELLKELKKKNQQGSTKEEEFVVHMALGIIKGGEELVVDPSEVIEEDDMLLKMVSGITDCFGELYSIGDMAKRMDVSLSLHTPYYEDLGSCVPNYEDLGLSLMYNDLPPAEKLTFSCVDNILYSGVVANALGAGIVATNLGIYNPEMDEMEVEDNIITNLSMIRDWWMEKDLKPKIGIEITGRDNVFGSMEQVLDICDEFKDCCVPVINWPNYYSRLMPQSPDTENAPSWDVEDFQYAIDQVSKYNNGQIYTQFSGIEYRNWSEYRLSPIKKGSLKFDTLAECLVNAKPDITIISSSPLLEHDAMYMRTIHERALTKKVLKRIKQERKTEAEEKKAEAEAAETGELPE